MDTQTINRKRLKAIYDSGICDGWKKRITEALTKQPFTDRIVVENKDILQAYSEASDSQKEMIRKYFKITIPKKISDKITGWKDILRLSGKREEDIIPWETANNKQQLSQNALSKIQLITSVYNQNVVLDWNNSNQRKYYPYFRKVSGSWVLYAVYCCLDCAYVPAGAYYKSEEDCRDAVSKFLNIYLDYLP